MPDLITCPKCGERFEAGAVLREQVERELRQAFQAEAQRQVARAVEAARAEAALAAQTATAANSLKAITLRALESFWSSSAHGRGKGAGVRWRGREVGPDLRGVLGSVAYSAA